jgi:hypothetical protein
MFNNSRLLHWRDEGLVEFFSPLDQLGRHARNLAFNVLLVAADHNPVAFLLHNKTLIFEVLNDRVDCTRFCELVRAAEGNQVIASLLETRFYFVNVQTRGPVDFLGVGFQQQILLGVGLHESCKLECLLEVVVFKKRDRELGEAVAVCVLFRDDDGQADGLERVFLEGGDLGAGSLGHRLGLVLVRAAKQESGYHLSHQVWVRELDNIEVSVAIVGAVGQQGCEEAVWLLSCEAEDSAPVEQPGSLVKHGHWTFRKPRFKHIFDPADGEELGGLAWLVAENLAGKKSPVNLGDERILTVGFSNEDLFQTVQVLFGL